MGPTGPTTSKRPRDVYGVSSTAIEGQNGFSPWSAYPNVSLKRASEKRDYGRRNVTDGIDPGAKRNAKRGAQTNPFVAPPTNGR